MPVLSCAIYVKSRLHWSKSWGQSALWDNSTVRSTLQIWSCLRSCVDSTATIKYHWGEILGITCWSRLTGQHYINFCAVESSIRYQHRMPSTHFTNSGTFYRIKTGSFHTYDCVQPSTCSQSIYAYTLLSYLPRMPSTNSTHSGTFYRIKTGSLHNQGYVQLNTYS